MNYDKNYEMILDYVRFHKEGDGLKALLSLKDSDNFEMVLSNHFKYIETNLELLKMYKNLESGTSK